MRFLSHKPYIILWGLIPIMLIYGFSLEEQTLDINIHDTYFVLSKVQIWYFLAHLFAIYGIVYWGILNFDRKIMYWLTSIHLLVTIIEIFLLTIVSPVFSSNFSAYNVINTREDTILITQSIIVLIIVVFQVLFLINLTIGIFQKKFKTS